MRKRVPAAAVVLAAVLAACDGKSSATGPSDARMSAADAASLSRQMFATGASFASGTVPAGARGNRISTASGTGSFSFTFASAPACPKGGTVGLAGTLSGGYDQVAQAAQVQANVAVTHHACALQTDQGATFTLNGDPKIDVALSASAGPSGVTALHATEQGAFTWSRDGGSGRCTVDLTADLVAGTQNVKLTGSFCGFPVDQTVSARG